MSNDRKVLVLNYSGRLWKALLAGPLGSGYQVQFPSQAPTTEQLEWADLIVLLRGNLETLKLVPFFYRNKTVVQTVDRELYDLCSGQGFFYADKRGWWLPILIVLGFVELADRGHRVGLGWK